MRTRIIGVGLAAVTLVSLSACSATDPAPAPTTTTRAVEAPCTGGVATLRADGQQSEHDGCDVFDVLGSDNALTVGAVKQLTIEGDHNTVTVHDAQTVTSVGDGNIVYYDGDEPEFNERGSGTKVIPSSAR